jgi:rhodanese-related sulfurtransferase
MKKLFFIIPLGLSLTAISCSNNPEIKEITVIESTIQHAKTINEDIDVKMFSELTTQEGGQILDVRTPEEWNGGIIKGAKKINFFDKDFNQQITSLDKTKPIYVYCKSGGRSGKAAKQLEKMGFTTIYNLLGGITAWNAAGKKIEKLKS